MKCIEAQLSLSPLSLCLIWSKQGRLTPGQTCTLAMWLLHIVWHPQETAAYVSCASWLISNRNKSILNIFNLVTYHFGWGKGKRNSLLSQMPQGLSLCCHLVQVSPSAEQPGWSQVTLSLLPMPHFTVQGKKKTQRRACSHSQPGWHPLRSPAVWLGQWSLC